MDFILSTLPADITNIKPSRQLEGRGYPRATGPQGPQGPQGSQGPQGPQARRGGGRVGRGRGQGLASHINADVGPAFFGLGYVGSMAQEKTGGSSNVVDAQGCRPKTLLHSHRADWGPAALSGRCTGGVLGVFWRCPAGLWGPSTINPARI